MRKQQDGVCRLSRILRGGAELACIDYQRHPAAEFALVCHTCREWTANEKVVQEIKSNPLEQKGE